MPEWPVRQLPKPQAALRDITSENTDARLAAIFSLADAPEELAGQARIALGAALDDPLSKIRAHAALALAEIGPDRYVERLIELADDQNGQVVQAAVIALGESRDQRAAATLENAIESHDPDVRFQAVIALSKISPEEALSQFPKVATDEDPEVRANVAAAIADIGDPQGISLLEPLLHDSHFSVRFEAAMAFSKFSDSRGVPVLIEALNRGDFAPQAVFELGKLGAKESAHGLRRVCMGWTNRAPLRAAAAASLASFEDPIGIQELDKWLRAYRREPRAMAIYMSGELKIASSAPRLCELLQKNRMTDRDSIARALGQIGDQKAIGSLRSVLSDPDSDVVSEAQKALEKLGED